VFWIFRKYWKKDFQDFCEMIVTLEKLESFSVFWIFRKYWKKDFQDFCEMIVT